MSVFALTLVTAVLSVAAPTRPAVSGLSVGAFDGEAYAVVQNGGKWRIGIVNHAERLAFRDVPLRIERHLTSDESFSLVTGKCELVFGETRPFTHVPLEIGKVYTVKRGNWHAVMTSPGAKVLVIEDADVSDANTERKAPDESFQPNSNFTMRGER